jgi:hypothetical protein
MTEILMALEKVPSKFSMMEDGEPVEKTPVPPLRRLVRLAHTAGRFRFRLPMPTPHTSESKVAAW